MSNYARKPIHSNAARQRGLRNSHEVQRELRLKREWKAREERDAAVEASMDRMVAWMDEFYADEDAEIAAGQQNSA